MKKEQYRQGDVLITRVDSIPPEATEREQPDGRNRSILMHGEATGHAHAVDAKRGVLYRNPSNDNRFLHVVKGGVSLKHEEHSTIKLPAGDYQVTRQREYDDEGEIRYVAD